MRATWRWWRASCVLIGLWSATGCGDDSVSADALAGRTFLLESSEGFEPVAGTSVRLSFEDEDLGFHAGCNPHAGAYSLEDELLIVENFRSTLIGCDPPRVHQDEVLAEFLLAKPQLELDGDRLTLSGSKITLVFSERVGADTDSKARE